MEFPPEILSIIREYSRPCFKYFREYKRVLQVKCVSEWPALRAALNNPGVVEAVLAYETASHEFSNLSFFDEEIDPDTWYRYDQKIGFYQKRNHLVYCETQLNSLIEPTRLQCDPLL
jgi:hypothetical protein